MRLTKYYSKVKYLRNKLFLFLQPNWFIKDFNNFVKQGEALREHPIVTLRPILKDKNDTAGVINGHYFHQDYYVAKKIFLAKPIKHVDVGSRIDGFVAHVAVFREIEIVDIRVLNSEISNIKFKLLDFTDNNILLEYCDSISSLHAIEHFGLGRYGDPINFNGHLVAIKNITKMLKKGGVFYFSVPIGMQRIEFNAHRVFSIKYLLQILLEDFTLISFSYVDDKGSIHENIELNEERIHKNCDCYHGCGIFELKKKDFEY